jgi:hypothetical protein
MHPIRLRLRPVLRGQLGRLPAATGAFEVGYIAAILRATDLLTLRSHGVTCRRTGLSARRVRVNLPSCHQPPHLTLMPTIVSPPCR